MAIAAKRNVETTWKGSLETGQGELKGTSGALDGLKVTWGSRIDRPDGRTSPEELAAAAHSSCFAMALELTLDQNKTSATQLNVSCTVSLEEVEGIPTVVSSAIEVNAKVEGIDQATFEEIVNKAAKLCPISRLFSGAKISVDAKLELVE